jgi:hypothetical protein
MLHHRLHFQQGFCFGAGARGENFPSATLRKKKSAVSATGHPVGKHVWFPSRGMVGRDFFKPYAVTFDFQNMQIFLQYKL